MRILLLLLLVVSPAALADIVELKSGGQIEGKVEQLEDGSYRVTTESGTVITLDRAQVMKVDSPSAEQQSYASRAFAAPDTVEAQLALARWCRESQLNTEAARHAERVVELDPTNAEARQLLNFRNVDGKWMTREQLMAERGMVWHDGRYRTRQEIAVLEQEEQLKQLNVYWRSELRKWRRWLDDRNADNVQQAVANFSNLSDPMAGPHLVDLLSDERDPKVRRLLAKTAGQIDHQATVNALVQLSLNDPDEEIRLQSLDALIRSGRPGLTEAYVKALRSNENAVVNRAGVALASLDDKSAIGPLIDALVTKHKKVVGNASGGDTYSVSPSTGGFSFGGSGPKEVSGLLRNPDVLSALVKLSNEHFGYDQSTWKKWHATQARMVQVDLRRDR
ncbi:HEAT repeat domain-containing protein [Aeoliella mucimassa]|uniref:HEAT repeat protein n=1 Tax=Aeoliella mucimassa TaxID=2527972 RepID=A0A518AQW6_9BACT|nr:HEAT repeat domain-containing protein [Aeoliella mucimassa]QDU57105.1 hypothetical protein Pan181_33190 [Aeoliella mucimassa]